MTLYIGAPIATEDEVTPTAAERETASQRAGVGGTFRPAAREDYPAAQLGAALAAVEDLSEALERMTRAVLAPDTARSRAALVVALREALATTDAHRRRAAELRRVELERLAPTLASLRPAARVERTAVAL